MSDWTETLLRILLDSSIRTALIAGAVGLILAANRARTSSVRHSNWTIVLFAMLLMPVLPYWIPAISIPSIPILIPLNPIPAQQVLPEGLSNATLPTAPVDVPSQPAPAAATRPNRSFWPYGVALVYSLISLVLLIRLVLGWLGMKRVFRSSQRVAPGGRPPIYSSALIATPITVGIVHHGIILPASWRLWAKQKRRAILAHEIAHIRRHDPLIGFLARVNCCLFWFHPLAWWLEKKLAITAEHACDDAAVRVIRQQRRYAEILLDMAEVVRRRGSRISWQGVGVHGNGLLGERIDRILSGRDPILSRSRRLGIALSSAAIVLLAVACRQSRPPIEEEMQALARVEVAQQSHNSRVYADQIRLRELQRLGQESRDLSPQQMTELEAKVQANGNDIQARTRLLAYYSRFLARPTSNASEIVPARRKHILWLIEVHPESDLHRSSLAFINVESADPLADPQGYAEGKKLWLEHTKRPDPSILSNAAYFLQVSDKPLAEQMLLRLQTVQPLGPWTGRLGILYSSMLLGATAIHPPFNDYIGNFVPLAMSVAEAHAPYVEDARKKLETTTNDELLTGVAQVLRYRATSKLDFDARALSTHYLERAAALNPKSTAVAELNRVRRGDRQDRIRNLPANGRYEAASALPDRDRFELLWDLAEFSYAYGNSFDTTHFEDARKEWEKSRKYAADLVTVAAKFRNDPEYGSALFNGNVMQGFVAAQDHDHAAALRFLREASKAPGSAKRSFHYLVPSAPWSRLCTALIDDGHSDDVIEFLDHFAELDPVQHDEILASAAKLRHGVMPDWYRRKPVA